MTAVRLVAFNFFERGLKNIRVHFCHTQSLSELPYFSYFLGFLISSISLLLCLNSLFCSYFLIFRFSLSVIIAERLFIAKVEHAFTRETCESISLWFFYKHNVCVYILNIKLSKIWSWFISDRCCIWVQNVPEKLCRPKIYQNWKCTDNPISDKEEVTKYWKFSEFLFFNTRYLIFC